MIGEFTVKGLTEEAYLELFKTIMDIQRHLHSSWVGWAKTELYLFQVDLWEREKRWQKLDHISEL